MKKVIGIAMIIVALFLVFDCYFANNKAEAEELASVEEMRTVLSERTEIPKPEVAEVAEDEVQPVEETHLFDWVSDAQVGTDIGICTIESQNISCVLGFGGTNSDLIKGKAGVNEDLSSVDHLFILGHNMKNETLFSYLPKVQVGDKLVLETVYGVFEGTCIDSFYVTPEEYEENNYAVTGGGDICLATCEWELNGTKGRHICIFDVDNIE